MPGTLGGALNDVEPEVFLDAHSHNTDRRTGSYLGPGCLPAERHGQPQAHMHASASTGIIRLQLRTLRYPKQPAIS